MDIFMLENESERHRNTKTARRITLLYCTKNKLGRTARNKKINSQVK